MKLEIHLIVPRKYDYSEDYFSYYDTYEHNTSGMNEFMTLGVDFHIPLYKLWE